jgi:uncharacterized protein (DUF488 family)
MKTHIYTFGYEGMQFDDFVRQLRSSNIHCVIDVRAMPVSRKKGFSKSALSISLNKAGIQYTHRVSMGCPKRVRDRYKANDNWLEYTINFMDYLRDQTDELKDIAKFVSEANCCLVCFEEDFNFCHRTYVARALSNLTGQSIFHIMDQRVIPDPKRVLAA